MSHYRKGTDFERVVKYYLEGEGYFVVRSAGSHGPVDLVAMKADTPTMLVQCKTGAPTGAEIVALELFAQDFIGYNVCFATPGGPTPKFTTPGA